MCASKLAPSLSCSPSPSQFEGTLDPGEDAVPGEPPPLCGQRAQPWWVGALGAFSQRRGRKSPQARAPPRSGFAWGAQCRQPRRWVAALKQGPAEQAGFFPALGLAREPAVPARMLWVPGLMEGASASAACGNPQHSQRPGQVADEEPEAKRGRVGPGPGS